MLNTSLFSKSNTVVFIDSSVPNYKTLQEGILKGVKTFIISPDRDGIEEIKGVLQQNPQITTLHLVSHGSPESLYLGNTELSLDNLENYQSLTKTWNVESILLHNSNNTESSTGDRISYVGLIGNPTSTNKINLSDTFITTGTPEAKSAVFPELNQTDISNSKLVLGNNVTEAEITSVQPNTNQAVDPVIPTTHPRILGCSCLSCARPLIELNRTNNQPQELTAPVLAALNLSQTFFLNSLAGANHTIYLDFNGHTTSGTGWNQGRRTNIVTPAFSLDNDTSFSSTELERIQYIWQRVAEDFSPFNVNVTTQAPTDINDLIRSGANDTRWGVRAVIGGSGLDWYGQRLAGIAFFDSFNDDIDTPTFIFSEDMAGAEKPIAETISHEVGHTIGLSHDGRRIPSEEYYLGGGSGETGWAPIMGFSDFQNVTQWSKGEYTSASNTEDDLQIITTQNGFGYRTDDTGDTIATAKALNVSGTTLSGSGIIERNTDIDYYSFFTGAGAISLTVNPFTRGPNLDIQARLFDSVGTFIVSSNPTESLFATIDISVAAGTYYLEIDGVGKGDPLGTGYTDYGSLGQYTINGNIAAANIDPTITLAVSPSSVTEDGTANLVYTFTRTENTSNALTVNYNVAGTATFNNDYSQIGAASFTDTTGTITFAANSATATLTIDPTADTIVEGDETVALSLTSGTGYIVGTATPITGTITNDDVLNQSPVVTTTGAPLSYIENATIAIDPALAVSDVDSANLASATVSITSGFVAGEDILSFTTQNGITGSYNSNTGVLSLTGAATVANYQTALRAITYTNSSDSPNTTPRTISFQVNDGSLDSTTVNRNINVTAVNDAPELTTTGSPLSYTENATIAIDPALAVSDVDSANLASATVSITSGFVVGEDILSFTTQNGITGSYNNNTGVLSLTGEATVANYQTALRAITYTNSSDSPNTTPRTISFQVNDGDLNSIAGTRNVIISTVNGAPEVTITGSPLSYIENATTAIDPAITVSDVDSANLASATVSITSGFVAGEDILSFTTQNGITGSYNSNTGVLSLTGAATVANYQTALRAITYTNSSDSPNTTPRTISFQVNDGSLDSTTVNRNINITAVNDAPTDINLSNSAVSENEAIGTIVGNFSTIDPDTGDTFTYSLVTGTGGTDNASFTISGNQLQTNAIFNSATKNTYSVLVRTTDQGNLSYDRQFSININPNNQDNVVTGTGNNENFITTAQKDIIDAQGGNDTITSTFANLQQNDTLNGGAGIDTLLITGGVAKLPQNDPLNRSTDAEALIIPGSTSIFGNFSTNFFGGTGFNPVVTPGETNDDAITINTNNANQLNIPGTTITGFERFDFSGFTDNITFIGNNSDDWIKAGAGKDNLIGGSGDDYLDGGTDADTMRGGRGNDFYYVDNVGDTITENAFQGTDTVFSTISYTLGNNLENLTLEGTSAINGTGNSARNTLIGNSGNNVLNGQAGADTMIGRAGDDSYYVDNTGDTIIENVNEGTDTVFSTRSYTLGNNLENLTLEGTSSINGTGNDLNNTLTGNSGNNILRGGAGADTITGGRGNDQIYLGLNDGAVDIVNYALNDGADQVYEFVRGIGGDQIQFTGITNIDVVTSANNTLLRLGDGTAGNAGFGNGQLLVTLSGTSGFIADDVNVNLFGANFLFN
ncbi:DUF4347 domain-containing protein [Nodularia harveyana UHCC-0300]|uniref:DUF4347 domain-containing protein n=1 Tax=Nodularia harveyana UHCC-0300 TaxID=2974287 RepID=A0ABU5UFQ1_9CYAN|nr:DUF4347 domain-containing protein [Nodularia harveyana]MEA5582347.1 DUF4347 domain-containing protein [Nodularia harveyana UHCC-0300]